MKLTPKINENNRLVIILRIFKKYRFKIRVNRKRLIINLINNNKKVDFHQKDYEKNTTGCND